MTNQQADALLLSLSTMLDVKGIAGFKIARNMRMIQEELKEYIQYKTELFKKYGEEKDGQLIVDKSSPLFEEFSQKLNDLNKQEVSFDFRKITEDELAESGLTAGQMAMIWEWMVDEHQSDS